LDTCNKFLECRLHRCGVINATRDLVQSVENIPTLVLVAEKQSGYFVLLILCDIRCTTVLNCTRHTCGAKCCTGNCLPCNRICNKSLLCGNHKCQALCHPGGCVQCPLIMDIFCHCKSIRQTIPCGKRIVLPHDIERTCVGLHRNSIVNCKFNWLDCSDACGNLLACGNHYCTLKCHQVTVRREIEGERNLVIEVNETNDRREDTCMPCILPCQKRMRPCKHPCPESCHFGPCNPCEMPIRYDCYCERIRKYISCWQTFDKELLSKLRSCGTICERPIEFCNHPCDLPCHPPKCPSDSCTKKVILRCKCKTIKQTVTCDIARAELKRLGILTFKTEILPCNSEHCLKKPENPKIEKPEPPKGIEPIQSKRKHFKPPIPLELVPSTPVKPPKSKTHKTACQNQHRWVAMSVTVFCLIFIIVSKFL